MARPAWCSTIRAGCAGTSGWMVIGAAVLNLVGQGQKGGIAMSVAPDGTPRLKMTDKAGKVLFEVPAASRR